MEDLLAARLQMAVSLGFHIIFACIGMTMPFLMAISEYKWLRTGSEVYLDLTKAWVKGVAIFFAVGAVSGTVLSFELGLLWPKFMEHAGPIFGMPFSWEGTAFFIEAIAIGLYLYGWNRLHKWVHWAVGLVVGISGVASGIFVVAANAWMNAPAGFDWIDGQAYNIDPFAAMFNKAFFSQALHMSLAAFVSTSFAVAGVHAILLLKNPGNIFHREAIKIALIVAAVTAILQPVSGDISAKDIVERQPVKFAAMESHFKTSKPAPLLLGGIPDEKSRSVKYGIYIPHLLSFLAHGDLNAEVAGLDLIPEEEWPPVLIVHFAFQIMIASGVFMMLVGLLYLFLRWKKPQLLFHKRFLKLIALTTPLGFIAVEAGWTLTEVGRQPWIIYGIMKTSEAVTPMPGIFYSLIIITGVYLILSFIVFWLMLRQVKIINQKYNA